jgi:uncharacterized OB-fold protein
MTTTPYLKPLPAISEANRPFWDGLAEHRFVVPRCGNCGDFGWVPYPACRTCLSEDLHWTQVSGHATVFSYSIVHRGPGAFGAEVPYAVVLAKLVEEPRPMIVVGNTVDTPNESLRIGLPLEIVYEDIPGEDVTLYRFRAREGA